MDIVLLSLFTTSAVVGAYGAAYRVLEATLFLAWSIGSSVLPMYSYLKPGDTPSLERVFEASLKFVVIIMMPIAVVMLVCAEGLVSLIYGLPEFETAVPVMCWLAFTVAYGVGHLAGVLVLVRRPGRVTVKAMAAVAAFNIAITLALIGPFDAQGVAAATLVTEVVLAATALVLARPVTEVPSAWRAGGPALLASVVMAAVMLPVRGELLVALPSAASPTSRSWRSWRPAASVGILPPSGGCCAHDPCRRLSPRRLCSTTEQRAIKGGQ